MGGTGIGNYNGAYGGGMNYGYASGSYMPTYGSASYIPGSNYMTSGSYAPTYATGSYMGSSMPIYSSGGSYMSNSYYPNTNTYLTG